jgi:hypothetical protein
MPLKRDNDEERRARLDRLMREARGPEPGGSPIRGAAAPRHRGARPLKARSAERHDKKAG